MAAVVYTVPMTTEKIVQEVNKISGEVRSPQDLEFLNDEDWGKLEQVSAKTTNPRRDYVGMEYIFLNKEDNKYFLIEIYGDDMYREVYKCFEVEKKVEVKEVITFNQKI